jgi:hypothetical protein
MANSKRTGDIMKELQITNRRNDIIIILISKGITVTFKNIIIKFCHTGAQQRLPTRR